MSAPYVGNNDFRGYLAYLGNQSSDPTTQGLANTALKFTGNDGGINQGTALQYAAGVNPAADQQNLTAYKDFVGNAFNNYNQLQGKTLGLSTYIGDPAQQAAYNQNTGIINSALGRLPNELGIAQGNIQGQYDTNLNQLNSGKAAADQQYQQSSNQNSQQFVGNKNQINNQASQGLQSLLRVLGQHGAGGSSAALYAAPNAVGQVASAQRSGAGQTFGQNQQGLDTNYNTYNTGFDNSKKQLSDWLSSQLQGAQSQSDQTRSGLLQQLAGLQPSVAAAQPYIDQINSLAGQVDQLAKLNPTYDGTTPTYTAPSVSSYTVQAPGSPVLGGGGNNTGAGSTPFLNFLLGQQKDKQQLQPAIGL